MSFRRCMQFGLLLVVCLAAFGCQLFPPRVGRNSPSGLLMASVGVMADAVEPAPGSAARTFHARFRVVEAEGGLKKIQTPEVELALQSPNRLFLKLPFAGKEFQIGRNGQQLWIFAPEKKFCLVGEPGVLPYVGLTDDQPGVESVSLRVANETPPMKPLRLPVSRARLSYLPRFLVVTRQPDEWIGTNACVRLAVHARPEAVSKRRFPEGRLELWLRQSDRLPQRISYTNSSGLRLTVEAADIGFETPWPAARWAFSPGDGDRTETVARSHLTRFLASRWSALNTKLPPLGPETGERSVIASEGDGRLETRDGTRVLFLKGSAEDMGRQHGVLMKDNIHRLVRDVLYGLGVGSSLAQGRWFFGEMEAAQRRLQPFMDDRYLREMDAMAVASGVSRAEVRMANMFPELFHCSGFAVFGDATTDGRLYHGRILDYFRSQGLEQNAVVMVFQPDYGHAWVNIGYSGFVGSVTAMNEKRIAIGEMGGRGVGQWDGKPMAQLVREVMEQADTIDDAVEIMRRSPRTCEYYYVISDGNSRRAVAIRATPAEFETVWAGEPHPMIPDVIKDVVYVSGGKRTEALIGRIKSAYGKLDAGAACDLMKRPVAMNSNIHCAIFAPETLDFWVANADTKNPASETRYTHYNLTELLTPTKATVTDSVR